MMRLTLAAVDAELAGDGSLAAARLVPGVHRLLQGRLTCRRGWYVVFCQWCSLVPRSRQMVRHGGAMLCLDEHHQQFEGADQCQGGPGADQGADRAMAQAVCQVGPDGRGDGRAQAPPRQRRRRPVAPAGVQDQHAGRPDQPVDREGYEPGGQPGLAVRAHQFVGVPVRADRRDHCDGGHRQRGGDLDQPARHRSNPRCR